MEWLVALQLLAVRFLFYNDQKFSLTLVWLYFIPLFPTYCCILTRFLRQFLGYWFSAGYFELGLIFRQALNFPCISVLVGTCFSFMISPLILPLHFLLTAVYLARVLQQFSELLVYSRRFSVG